MAIPLVGKCFATAAEFLAYLERLQFSAWRPRFVTMHHTGSPDLATWRGWQTRAKPVSDAKWMENLAGAPAGMECRAALLLHAKQFLRPVAADRARRARGLLQRGFMGRRVCQRFAGPGLTATRARTLATAGNNPGGDEARNWNDEVDILQEFLKAWGPPGLIAVILWVFLFKSERREEKKDARIQMLENQLRESYDERIEAAARLPQTGYRGECGRGDRAEDRRTFRAERSGMTSSRPR